MTQTSRPWSDEAVGDGVLSPYDNDEWSDIWRKLFQRDRTVQGYIEGYENELLVSNPAGTTIRVATGAALVDGKFYENDDNEDNSIAAPAVSTRIDRVVLRKSWAAQTVRIVIITGIEGGGVPPLVQTDGTTWDIPLAQVNITTAPVITITDEREVSRTPLAEEGVEALIHIETLVGDGSSPNLDFTGISASYRHLMIIGQIRLDGAVVDADVDLRFNNDGGANYNEQDIVGSNAATAAAAAAAQTEANVGTFPGATGVANHAGQIVLHIANYAEADFFKTFTGEFMNIPNAVVANFDVGNVSGLWEDVSAIDQITLISSSGNFETGTRVSLYGMS